MTKISLRALTVGTSFFFTLLGLGLIGLRPAFELAIFFSNPSIYVIGPLLNLLPYDWFEGPIGGVMAIMISSWIEMMIISLAIGIILYRARLRKAQ